MKVGVFKRLVCGWVSGIRWEKGFKVRLELGFVFELLYVVVFVGEEVVWVVVVVFVVVEVIVEDSSCFVFW